MAVVHGGTGNPLNPATGRVTICDVSASVCDAEKIAEGFRSLFLLTYSHKLNILAAIRS